MSSIHLEQYTVVAIFLSLIMLRLDKTFAKTAHEEKYVLRGKQFPLELFPLIDDLNIEQAFTRRSYMKFLMKCVFFEGHCDLIGKWLKPRTLAALNGECLACTDYQRKNMERWLLTLIHHNQDLFRVAMIKVCIDMNILVPEDEKVRIIPYLTRKDLKALYPNRFGT